MFGDCVLGCPSNSLKTAGVCVCNAGFEASGSLCAACASGKYTAGANVACADPPANAIAPDTRSFLCDAGYSLPVLAGACSACAAGKVAIGNNVQDCLPCNKHTKSIPGSASCQHICNSSALSVMTATFCAALTAGSDISTHTAAPLGTTQLVRYSFADSWGCNLQAELPAAQIISGVAPNQVMACPPIQIGRAHV